MAHFAEIDENNVVLRVVVVSNEETHDVNGVENEELGIAFCKKIFGINTKWVQTSYNANFRKNYAGIGSIYKKDIDAFVAQQPYPSWVLNEETAQWEAPTPMPLLSEQEADEKKFYTWNEDIQNWELKQFA